MRTLGLISRAKACLFHLPLLFSSNMDGGLLLACWMPYGWFIIITSIVHVVMDANNIYGWMVWMPGDSDVEEERKRKREKGRKKPVSVFIRCFKRI